MKAIKEFAISFEIEHEQYWQGHGISCTPYDRCATGIGDTLNEALEDAIDDLTNQDIDTTDAQLAEMRDILVGMIKGDYDLNSDIVAAQCYEHGKHARNGSDNCSVCAGEWLIYVNIDVITE